ncbi:MAG: isoprenyl transferase [bacterium]
MKSSHRAENRLRSERTPKHVAIIMDGNGRWADKHGLSRIKGHWAGANSIREVVRTAGELGISYLTLYSFSVDNWKRPRREVSSLMSLLKRFLRKEERELNRNNVRLRVIGRIDGLPEDVQRAIEKAVKGTAANTGLTLVLALNYGSRNEIADAARALCEKSARGALRPEDVNEGLISENLSTAGMPDPDLLIRTSGEMRISNFMLWQISYAELYVTPVYWPDFRKAHFVQAILDYQGRERRFGGVVGRGEKG